MNGGYRKAALKLHGMNDADRSWMLQHLSKDDNARLRALLQELRELGIQPNRQAADDVTAEDAREELLSAAGQTGLAHALDIVSAAHAEEIAALLDAEPDMMAATILSVYPWPWRAAYLGGCGIEKRQRLRRALSQAPKLKPRLRGELIKLLAGRMAAVTRQFPLVDPLQRALPAPPSTRSLWKGMLQWLR